MADFVYNVVEQSLTGGIDGTFLSAHAVSGGRAGSKTKGATNVFLANNPYATNVKKRGDANPGGAIPLAAFYLKTHESRKNWVRLVPLDASDLKGRDGFAIHGRGARGSDGCIVPTDFHNVLLLHKLTKAREEAKGPAPTLQVVAIGDLDQFERLMNMA
jgi:hypothetical protein